MEYNPPPFFKRGPTPLIRLLLCSLLSIVMLITDVRYRYLDNIRQAVSVAIYPLLRLAAAPRALLDNVGEFFVTQAALRGNHVDYG
jgi:rod shape-determining protein MreC